MTERQKLFNAQTPSKQVVLGAETDIDPQILEVAIRRAKKIKKLIAELEKYRTVRQDVLEREFNI